MQNPGFDAWGICGLAILVFCLVWLGTNKLRKIFQKPKKTDGCGRESDAIRVLSEEDSKKYAGKHVCTISFQDHAVVSAHLDAVIAKEEATAKGHPDAVCFPVPRPFDRFTFIETSEACTFR